MDIYLAAPLFNDCEREFNARLAGLLQRFGPVFLPQRDGKLIIELVRNGMGVREARRRVFDADIDAIHRARCIVAVLDGRTIDEGVAFELGYGRALGKTCFGLKTDDRALLASGDNPMIEGALDAIFHSVDDLLARFHSAELGAGVRLD